MAGRVVAPWRYESARSARMNMTTIQQGAYRDAVTEDQARKAIINNGYRITVRGGRIEAREPSMRRGPRPRTWTGVNYLDLATEFKLHQRPAKLK